MAQLAAPGRVRGLVENFKRLRQPPTPFLYSGALFPRSGTPLNSFGSKKYAESKILSFWELIFIDFWPVLITGMGRARKSCHVSTFEENIQMVQQARQVGLCQEAGFGRPCQSCQHWYTCRPCRANQFWLFGHAVSLVSCQDIARVGRVFGTTYSWPGSARPIVSTSPFL